MERLRREIISAIKQVISANNTTAFCSYYVSKNYSLCNLKIWACFLMSRKTEIQCLKFLRTPKTRIYFELQWVDPYVRCNGQIFAITSWPALHVLPFWAITSVSSQLQLPFLILITDQFTNNSDQNWINIVNLVRSTRKRAININQKQHKRQNTFWQSASWKVNRRI